MMYVVDSHQNVVRRMFSYRIGSIRIRSDQIGSKRIILDQIGLDRIYRQLILPLAKVSDKGASMSSSHFSSDRINPYQIGSKRIKSDQNGSDRIGSISNSSCLLPKSRIKAWQWRPRSPTAPRRWRPGCHRGREPEG